MQFHIADTFTDSLARLTADEQKAVKTTAFDLQLNPASPGMQFHKLDKVRDSNFWSVRVSRDIRLIAHKTDADLLLCYVDHHDAAYRWAERLRRIRKPARPSSSNSARRSRRLPSPATWRSKNPHPPRPPLFAKISEDELLSYGVPSEWLDDVRRATEDTLFELADHLPREAAEALLDLATGVTPHVPQAAPAGASPFEHPDALRRFRVMADVEELQRALDFPWEKWTVFLHPAQRDLVEGRYNGPARVSGSAGTGKTIVALHRAVHLARMHPQAAVLITTFSDTLAGSLRYKLRTLVGNEPQVSERITVATLPEVGRKLYAEAHGEPQLTADATLRELLAAAAAHGETHSFSEAFLWAEWNEVVDAWQLDSWEAYRDVARLGRKTRLAENHRRILWDVFERVRAEVAERDLVTTAGLLARMTEHLLQSENGRSPYDFVIVDEAQDVGVAELRFLAALGRSRPDALFFTGDQGQRIFQPPFSWKSLGVDIRGRSRTLRINYRTSHQIRLQADRLLPPEVSDVDGNTENRRGTVSVFNGPDPLIRVLTSEQEEIDAAAEWLAGRTAEGIQPHEIGLFVRDAAQIPRARRAVKAAGLDALELQETAQTQGGRVSIMTMHLAKGLEFRAVGVLACDDEVLPLNSRIEGVTDDGDLEDVYNTERHLLYVACTRARDHLLVTGVDPASEFLDDLGLG